jgi:hypothetical protein
MIEYSRELTGAVMGASIVLLLFTLWNRFNNYTETKKVKKSNLAKNINKIMEGWKEEIVVSFSPERRIKLTFPGEVCEDQIFFYLIEQDDGSILITESGEIVQRLDLGKTVNKHAVKRVAWTFDLDYERHLKSIYIKSSEDKLKDDIWRMLYTLLLLEYARY